MTDTPDARALRDLLPEWTDADGAMHAVAVCLGLMPSDWGWVLSNAKWVFWSDNPTGNALFGMLRSLVEVGVLQENEEGRFQYNPDYATPWTVADA